MARVRRLEIKNFRSIKGLVWHPSDGINCLIGPGDSGKSSILDAIDLCLGARRSVQFTDADFFQLNTESSIEITVVIGDLSDGLKSLDGYGLFVQGFDLATKTLEDEPRQNFETVLSLRLSVGSDLEPHWSLVSERAVAQGVAKSLSWPDRVRLAPTKIGAFASHNLGWGRGSVLNRVSEERADASAALAQAARQARSAFGESTKDQLAQTLKIVADTAKEMGVPVGEQVRAMLDVQSSSFSGGTISLHDTAGVPLSALGIGSTRLMVAGLQRKAAADASIVLVDELEHGLEPQRIVRFLDSLGAKESNHPLQAFLSTHSPVAIRELSVDQIFVVRRRDDATVEVVAAGAQANVDSIQGTLRLNPEAFLSSSILVCEGASEVGLLRGFDRVFAERIGFMAARGTVLVDGGGVSKLCARARAFHDLGYRVAILRDDDAQPDPQEEAAVVAAGIQTFIWSNKHALEQELFLRVDETTVHALVERAIELSGESVVADNIKSASKGKVTLALCRATILAEHREALGVAAKAKPGWFKSVTKMEGVAFDIVGPAFDNAAPEFRDFVIQVLAWIHRAE